MLNCGCIQTLLLSYTQFCSIRSDFWPYSLLFSCWLSVFLALIWFFFYFIFNSKRCLVAFVGWSFGEKIVTASQPPIISQFVLDLMQQQQQKKRNCTEFNTVYGLCVYVYKIYVWFWYTVCLFSGILRSVWLRLFFLFPGCYFLIFAKKSTQMISFDYTWLRIRFTCTQSHDSTQTPFIFFFLFFLVLCSLSSFIVAFQLPIRRPFSPDTTHNLAHCCLPMIPNDTNATLTTFNILIDV